MRGVMPDFTGCPCLKECDQYFVRVIKCLCAKVLTTVGMYDVLQRPYESVTFSPVRMIVGGGIELEEGTNIEELSFVEQWMVFWTTGGGINRWSPWEYFWKNIFATPIKEKYQADVDGSSTQTRFAGGLQANDPSQIIQGLDQYQSKDQWRENQIEALAVSVYLKMEVYCSNYFFSSNSLSCNGRFNKQIINSRIS